MLLDPQVIDDPYPFYGQLHTRAPVWQVPGTEVVVVSSFELVAEATARVEDFSSSMHHLLYCDEEGLPRRLAFGEGTQVLAVADPPIHTLHRSVVFPELVARRMAGLDAEIRDLVVRCVGRALDEGKVDFMAYLGNVVPITMILGLIGFRGGDPDRLLRAAFDSTALVGARLSLEELQTLLVSSAEIAAWIAEQLTTIVDHSGDDILSAVARGIDAGALSQGDGTIILQNLLGAGGESTTSLLGNAVRIIAERPGLQEQLRQDPELIPSFVEEALRLESPFRFLLRHTSASTTLGGVDIPADTTVLLFWGAANRDPAEYERSDEVVLDRKAPRHHLAFGRGIHHCVGAPLARLEAHVVLTVLLEETSNITIDPEQSPRWFDSLQVRRHEYLPVHLVAR
jgi:cytochrome P450 family 144